MSNTRSRFIRPKSRFIGLTRLHELSGSSRLQHLACVSWHAELEGQPLRVGAPPERPLGGRDTQVPMTPPLRERKVGHLGPRHLFWQFDRRREAVCRVPPFGFEPLHKRTRRTRRFVVSDNQPVAALYGSLDPVTTLKNAPDRGAVARDPVPHPPYPCEACQRVSGLLGREGGARPIYGRAGGVNCARTEPVTGEPGPEVLHHGHPEDGLPCFSGGRVETAMLVGDTADRGVGAQRVAARSGEGYGSTSDRRAGARTQGATYRRRDLFVVRNRERDAGGDAENESDNAASCDAERGNIHMGMPAVAA